MQSFELKRGSGNACTGKLGMIIRIWSGQENENEKGVWRSSIQYTLIRKLDETVSNLYSARKRAGRDLFNSVEYTSLINQSGATTPLKLVCDRKQFEIS